MKNPFKKLNLVDTAVNLVVGGGANVAMDYAFANISALDSVKEYKNVIKIAAGAVAGAVISNKYARMAADGIATVGMSNLIAEYIAPETTEEPKSTTGLPEGTIGRIRLGQRGFKGGRGVRGVQGSDVMGC